MHPVEFWETGSIAELEVQCEASRNRSLERHAEVRRRERINVTCAVILIAVTPFVTSSIHHL